MREKGQGPQVRSGEEVGWWCWAAGGRREATRRAWVWAWFFLQGEARQWSWTPLDFLLLDWRFLLPIPLIDCSVRIHRLDSRRHIRRDRGSEGRILPNLAEPDPTSLLLGAWGARCQRRYTFLEGSIRVRRHRTLSDMQQPSGCGRWWRAWRRGGEEGGWCGGEEGDEGGGWRG